LKFVSNSSVLASKPEPYYRIFILKGAGQQVLPFYVYNRSRQEYVTSNKLKPLKLMVKPSALKPVVWHAKQMEP